MPMHPRSIRETASGREPVRLHAIPLLLASLAFAAGCGDTLVDHEGRRFVSLCQETVTSCGVGSACVDCTDAASYAPPANGQATCGTASACDFECNPGWLRCGGACCRALSVAAGWYHTCAVLGQPGDASGRLRCWGANNEGQLGNGDALFQDSPVPVDVVGLASGVTQVAAGAFHTCAIQNGTSYCWGMNAQGQVGAGFTDPAYAYPQPVTNVPAGGFTQLAPGGGHTCARSDTGDVWCWGANDLGQLGQGAPGSSFNNKPLRVSSLSGIASVAAGRYHACALTSGGSVSCWGADDYGQIGDGVAGPFPTGRDVPTPTPIGSLAGVIAIAAGNQFSLAITPGAPGPQLWGWGTNAAGELGSAHPPDAISVPTLASAVSAKPTALAAGRAHTCALSGGGLECFGADDRSQLGAPAGSDVVVSFGVASAPTQVAAGYDHTCAVLADGSLYCWGSDERGQVGDGLVDPSNPVGTPTLVTGR
jgi:alpha-tubulin suppressor-like RCC1 family protein